MAAQAKLYGMSAEFEDAHALLEAARKAREAGFKRFDAYSPIPIHGMEDAIGQRFTRLPFETFFFGVLGGSLGYLLQYWTTVVDYPLNVGGRPYHSWPAFIPVTFECIILFAAFSTAIGMVLMNGLPLPYHPVFNAPNFDRASVDRFFLCIEAEDPRFDAEETRTFLEELKPNAISEVHY